MPPFQSACAYADVPAGGVLAVNVEGLEVAIVRADDGVYAIKDECSHAAIALSEGDVDAAGCEIECWLHGSRFDLRTGKPTSLPAYEPVPVYPCKIEGDTIVVDLENPFTDSEI